MVDFSEQQIVGGRFQRVNSVLKYTCHSLIIKKYFRISLQTGDFRYLKKILKILNAISVLNSIILIWEVFLLHQGPKEHYEVLEGKTHFQNN